MNLLESRFEKWNKIKKQIPEDDVRIMEQVEKMDNAEELIETIRKWR